MNPLLRTLRRYVRHVPAGPGVAQLAGRLNEHLKNHPVTTVTRTRSGTLFPVTTSDVIQRYLYLFGVWEPHLTSFVSRRLHPGDTFLDVGANIGYYTVLASRLVGPTGRVVAVEPSPDFHQALTGNVRLNGCANVRTVNTAVSDTPGRLTFYLEDPTNLGGTTAVRPRTVTSSFTADTAPLSRLLTTDEVTTARLIKIDVEGGEAGAVRGLLPVLDHLRDDVELLVEVTPRLLAKQGQTVDQILNPLRDHGFHPYRVTNDYDAASYPPALRRPSSAARWREPVTEMTDLVFSRVDADALTS
ncbi:FkbM family methyltransferase [Streptomyces acidiscabies]|uniref:FkbM family methyltransferase n=1 Tax=Streptomyces acidiscabies TaxID=42234 RepID=UPI0030CB4D60